MALNNLVRAAVFCALAIAVGFALMMVPNVELITVTVFISGLTLGWKWGALVGGTAIFVYSGMNPLGSGLSFPPLFFMQIFGMALIGSFGGLLRPLFFVEKMNLFTFFGLALVGFLSTFTYDALTMISYPISAGLGIPGIVAALIKGLGFTLLHEISNAVIFVTAVPLVVKHLK